MAEKGPDLTPALVDAAGRLGASAATRGAPALVAPTTRFRKLQSGRLRRWTGIFSAYFGTQAVTQVLGFLAGLLFIRYMPVAEFALYTLAMSVVTFFAFATDLGSTTSLVHFFHRASREGDDFGHYLAAVASLRGVAFAIGAAIVVIALPTTAHAKGFRVVDIGLVTAAVLAAVAFQIVGALRQLTLRLEDHFGRSYRADLAGGALRLVLAASLVASAALKSWLAVMVGAAASALTGWLARNPTRRPPDTLAADLTPYRRAVLRYLLPTLPSAFYFAIQGPLVVWLAATFGASRNMAEVGALTRLGLLVGLFSGLTGVVFMPRLARVLDERVFRARVLQFGAVHLSLAGALFVAAGLWPEAFLWLLGPHYRGLHHELLLVVGGAGLSLLDGYLVAVNLSRSWTRWQTPTLALLVASQAGMIATLPLSRTEAVLTFNLACAAIALVSQLTTVVVGFVAPHRVRWA